jgi:hypothetical protein
VGVRGLALVAFTSLCVLAGGLVFSVVPALAAAPEAPETLSPAKSITATSAVLEGVLNPHVLAKSGWYFFYSSEISCLIGQASTPQEPEIEGQALAEHVEVTGLQPSKTYRFCMVATNQAGESTPSANEVSFTTLAAPPGLEGETSSGVNSTAATLEAQVNPNNQATSCAIEYGSTNAYGTKAPCEPASLEGFGNQRVSLPLTGLTPGTTHHFRIVVENAAKGKFEGTDQTVTTVPTPNTDPVTSIASTTATFNGHLTLDPVDTQYFFYYKVGPECFYEHSTPQEDAGSGSGTLASPSVPVTGLQPATQYKVCMVTTNAFGSEQAAPVTFTTLPSAPKVASESVQYSGRQVLLNAQIVPNGASTTYQFEYGETSSYGTSIPASAGNIGSGNETVTVPAAEPSLKGNSTLYHYRVVAINQYGTTDGPDQTLLTPPLSGPTNVAGATGLPDGRVYELVSPANKSGNVVNNEFFGLAAEDGNAVVFQGSGPMGTSFGGTVSDFVARRSASGWATSSAIPRQTGMARGAVPFALVPSSDFSRFVFFEPCASYVSTEPPGGGSSNIFLTENQAVEPDWISRPVITDPIPALGASASTCGYEATYTFVAGGTPSLSTVYFSYAGTLLPEDESRAPYVGNGQGYGNGLPGFYEWNKGTLKDAGVLPDGTVNPFGAVPAAYAPKYLGVVQADTLANEVSSDGSRAFFVSPDPNAIASGLTSEPSELYVRKTAPDGAKSTVLVSQSQLPGHVGERAGKSAFLYASSDGSQAFFSSTDQLTSAAPKDSSLKVYDFDVNTGALTYLPGVAGTTNTPTADQFGKPAGAIDASSPDGSDFIFENTATAMLELWSAGAGGGRVTPITPLPGAGGGFSSEGVGNVGNGRASADGSVFVFTTGSPVPGGFNNAGGFEQVYRYDVTTSALTCVSCPPVGVSPSGDAHVSYDNGGTAAGTPMSVQDTRVVSSDGSRVFFDSPDPLVPQASNGMRNVYEWENGVVSLISSGKSRDNSSVLDSTPSGGDVFFATSSGLVPGDRDAAYDVYDARIPRPGDRPPTLAAPCEGAVCQGPPSVPALLGAPASAAFSGAGNLTPPTPVPLKSKTAAQIRAQKLVKALRACHTKHNRGKRRACEARARRRFAPTNARKASDTTATRKGGK